jgi:F-type H+-transporting ATPase subunit delta
VSRVSLVAKRYAKALFASVQNKELVLNEVRIIAKVFMEDVSIGEFFSSHFHSDAQKKEVITKAFHSKGLSTELFNFMMVLADKGRVQHIQDILLAFESLVDLQNGLTRGTVKSAFKLDQEARLKIEGVVSHFIKKKVILTYSEDSTLVGGVVAQVAGWTFEDTLDSHLRRLKEELNRRAN